jgi:hypothetical protein
MHAKTATKAISLRSTMTLHEVPQGDVLVDLRHTTNFAARNQTMLMFHTLGSGINEQTGKKY